MGTLVAEEAQGEAGDEDIVLQEYHSEDETTLEDRPVAALIILCTAK